MSPFALRARHRAMLKRIRSRAPKHPKGPEHHLRIVTARLFNAYHDHLKKAVVNIASAYLRKKERRDAKQDPVLRSVLSSSWEYGQQLLHESPYKKALKAAAHSTAKSAINQTASSLGLGQKFKPDLTKTTDGLANSVFDSTSDLIDESIKRAEDVLNEWSDLDPDYSDRAEDTDALDDMLDDGLDGISGKAVAAAGLAFGYAFSDMIRESQEDAGVSSYMWLTANDSRVRPAHAQLDGEIADWDEPPLSASESDNEEDDHPGEDYGCRCVASPVDPNEGLTERQIERL